MISLDLNHPRFLDFWKAVESILFWWLVHCAWNPWISSVLPTGHDRETAAFGCPIHALFLFLFFFFCFHFRRCVSLFGPEWAISFMNQMSDPNRRAVRFRIRPRTWLGCRHACDLHADRWIGFFPCHFSLFIPYPQYRFSFRCR